MSNRSERLAELKAHFATISEYAEKDGARMDYVEALTVYGIKRWGLWAGTARDYAKTVLLQAGLPLEMIKHHSLEKSPGQFSGVRSGIRITAAPQIELGSPMLNGDSDEQA